MGSRRLRLAYLGLLSRDLRLILFGVLLGVLLCLGMSLVQLYQLHALRPTLEGVVTVAATPHSSPGPPGR